MLHYKQMYLKPKSGQSHIYNIYYVLSTSNYKRCSKYKAWFTACFSYWFGHKAQVFIYLLLTMLNRLGQKNSSESTKCLVIGTKAYTTKFVLPIWLAWLVRDFRSDQVFNQNLSNLWDRSGKLNNTTKKANTFKSSAVSMVKLLKSNAHNNPKLFL